MPTVGRTRSLARRNGDVQAPEPRVAPAPSSDAPAADEKMPVLRSHGGVAFEHIDAKYAGKTVVDREVSSSSREQYRRLGASLHHAQEATGLKIVMVTSAAAGEGKTLTSSNLALTLSESYQRQVLLIDADLRRPSLQKVFRVEAEAGLSEGLDPARDLTVPVHQVTSRLGLLVAGRPVSDPMAGLTSLRMRRLLDEARQRYDWIILDTPPVALLTDANLLGAMVDGSIIVVKAGVTPWYMVQRAIDAIGRDRTMGIVLNNAQQESGAGYYDYHYYGAAAELPSST
jgi:protein-tyrosine kinase